MSQLVVSVVGGILLGGTYALIGLGLVLAFRATHTFNFAHGELMLFPAFLLATWQANETVPDLLGVALALVLGGVVGIGMYVFVLSRTIGLPHLIGVAATFGLAAVFQGILQIWFGSAQYKVSLPGLPEGRMEILGAGVSRSALVLAFVANFIAILVALFMRRTDAGIRIRAAGQDPVLAAQGGINVRRVFLGSWAMAGVLAAIAGLAYGSANLFQLSAVGIALAAAPAIVLGGLDSIEGAIVGGVCIGLVQSFTGSYLGGEFINPITYSILLLVLLVYPSGLFGTAQVKRL